MLARLAGSDMGRLLGSLTGTGSLCRGDFVGEFDSGFSLALFLLLTRRFESIG